MSIMICKGCGGTTNSTTCDFLNHKDRLPRVCYIKWVNDKPVKGCGYDDFKLDVLRTKEKYSYHHLKWMSDILKKG